MSDLVIVGGCVWALVGTGIACLYVIFSSRRTRFFYFYFAFCLLFAVYRLDFRVCVCNFESIFNFTFC